MPDGVLAQNEAMRAYCERLTRLNHRLMALLTTVLLVILVLVVAGAQRSGPSDVVITKELRIVDSKGIVRAIFGAEKSATAADVIRLVMRDEVRGMLVVGPREILRWVFSPFRSHRGKVV